MAVTLNASTSSGFIQTADTSGDLALQSNGTTQFNVTSTGAYGQVKSGTAVTTTSGTSIDFTSIPSWVKRITVMFQGVSTNGLSLFRVRIGPTAGVETTGYVGASGSPTSVALFSSGFDIVSNNAASTTQQGLFTLALLDASTNTWAASWVIGNAVNAGVGIGGGSKSLSGALSIVRITTVNGTDTFDAGSINILYEG
jgi:hypothetical protein